MGNTIDWIALDVAKSCGVAILYSSGVVRVTTVVGSPQQQLDRLVEIIGDNNEFSLVIETLTYFRNAKTIRSLLERSGFLKYSLMNSYLIKKIEQVSATDARKALRVKSKGEALKFFRKYLPKINNDESDALALLWALGVINKKTIYERLA